MAEVTLGQGITAAQYNDLRTRMLAVCTDYGLTQAQIESYLGTTWPAKTAGSSISNTDWDKLFLVIYWCRVHQTNAADVGLPQTADNNQFTNATPIQAGDGYEYNTTTGEPIGPGPDGLDKGYNDLEEAVQLCEEFSLTHAAGQFTDGASQATSADTSSTAWGGGVNDSNLGGSPGFELVGDNSLGQIRREFDITFTNSTARDKFFAMGGEVTMYARLTNAQGVPFTSDPGGAKANWWYNHLNVSNPINFVINKQLFDVLTTSYQSVIQKFDSDDNTYQLNTTKLEMKRNANNNVISVKIVCADNDRSSKQWPDEPRDENVGQRVATWCAIKTIAGATNPLFNTIGTIPSVSITQAWVVEAITGQAPPAAPPTAPGPFTLSVSQKGDITGAGTTSYTLGTFTIPANFWKVNINFSTFADGDTTYIFGIFKDRSYYGGNNRLRIYEGDTSGPVVYDSGIVLGMVTGYTTRNISAQFLKTMTGGQLYTAQFTSREDAPTRTNTGCTVTITANFNGFE